MGMAFLYTVIQKFLLLLSVLIRKCKASIAQRTRERTHFLSSREAGQRLITFKCLGPDSQASAGGTNTSSDVAELEVGCWLVVARVYWQAE